MRSPEIMSPLRVIKLKAMKNDKGREGGHKIGKMGRHRYGWPLNTTSARPYPSPILLDPHPPQKSNIIYVGQDS